MARQQVRLPLGSCGQLTFTHRHFWKWFFWISTVCFLEQRVRLARWTPCSSPCPPFWCGGAPAENRAWSVLLHVEYKLQCCFFAGLLWESFCFSCSVALLLGLLKFWISKHLVYSVGMCALDSVKCGLGVLYLCPPHCNTKRMWPQWILAFGDEGFLLLLCWRLVLWLWGRINLPALPFLYHRKELNYPLRGLFISWLFIPSHWRKKDSRKNNIQYFPLCTGLGKKDEPFSPCSTLEVESRDTLFLLRRTSRCRQSLAPFALSQQLAGDTRVLWPWPWV